MGNSAPIAATLQPPYYAVIFTSIRTDSAEGYDAAADRMAQLASEQPGYLGMESVLQNGVGITVSYWSSGDAVLGWKRNLEHRAAQKCGRDTWYSQYKVRVAKVERDYEFAK